MCSNEPAENGHEIVEATQKRGMVLPFDQHSITFDDIRYSVDMPQVMNPLLNYSKLHRLVILEMNLN